MNKKIGILGFLLATAIGMFQPAAASAQDRDDHRAAHIQDYGRPLDNRDNRNQGFDRREDDRRFDHNASYRRPTRTFIERRGR